LYIPTHQQLLPATLAVIPLQSQLALKQKLMEKF